MTPRMSIVGQIAHLRLFTQLRWRAVLFSGLTLVFALLAFFPERYLATSSFTPSDRDSMGLSGTLGQLGALNSVFGNQAAVVGQPDLGKQRNGVRAREHVAKTRSDAMVRRGQQLKAARQQLEAA